MIATPRDEGDPITAARGHPEPSRWLAGLWLAARPHYRTKKLACFAVLIFSGRLVQPIAVAKAFASFAAFCLSALAVYVLNDVCDRQRDRLDLPGFRCRVADFFAGPPETTIVH